LFLIGSFINNHCYKEAVCLQDDHGLW